MLFFLGVVCGIAIVILYALYLAARKPKEALPRPPATLSVSAAVALPI